MRLERCVVRLARVFLRLRGQSLRPSHLLCIIFLVGTILQATRLDLEPVEKDVAYTYPVPLEAAFLLLGTHSTREWGKVLSTGLTGTKRSPVVGSGLELPGKTSITSVTRGNNI